jgi:hypothetical protein
MDRRESTLHLHGVQQRASSRIGTNTKGSGRFEGHNARRSPDGLRLVGGPIHAGDVNVARRAAGADDFRGPCFHIADWRDDFDLTGKRIAGAGAGGFKLVPAMADSTEQVDVYQRTPQWMAPNPS